MSEIVIERLVVELGAKMDQYLKAFTEAKKVAVDLDEQRRRGLEVEKQVQTSQEKTAARQKELNDLLKAGAISQETFNRALRSMESPSKSWADSTKGISGNLHTALGDIKAFGSLSRSEFTTTGEAMGKLGDIAATIPGPWGAAGAAVLKVGGEIVDWFEGPLIRAQQKARDGFMSIAIGARSLGVAMKDLEVQALTSGLERLATIQQRQRQGVGGQVGGQAQDNWGMFLGPHNILAEVTGIGGIGFSQEGNTEAQVVARARGAARRIRNETQGLLDAPNQELRTELGTAISLRDNLQQIDSFRERRLHRQMFRAMHGGGRGDVATQMGQLDNAIEERSIRRWMRMTGQSREAALANTELTTSIRTLQETMRQEVAFAALDRVEQQSSQALQQVREQIGAVGLPRSEARARQMEAGLQRAVALGASGGGVQRTRNQIALFRQQSDELERQQRLYKLQQETVLTTFKIQGDQAQVQDLLTNTWSARVDMSRELARIETEFQRTGNTRKRDEELAVLALSEQLRIRQRISQEIVRTTQQTRIPEETFRMEQSRLMTLLMRGMNPEVFGRAMQSAAERLDNASESFRHWNAQVQAGAQIVQGFLTPEQRLDNQIMSLESAYAEGTIRADEYQMAVGRLRSQFEGLNNAMQLTPAVAFNSAEALGRMDAYLQRVAPVEGVGLPTRPRPSRPSETAGGGGATGFGRDLLQVIINVLRDIKDQTVFIGDAGLS